MNTTIKITGLILLIFVLMISMISCSNDETEIYYEEIPSDEQIIEEMYTVFENNSLLKDVEIKSIEITEKYNFELFEKYTVYIKVNNEKEYKVIYALEEIFENDVSIKRWKRFSVVEV